MNAEAIALTAAIDQAYEGVKCQTTEMVTEVRSQIADGFDRDAIITGHMMYLKMRYTAVELATLTSVLVYENAKEQA